MDTKIIEFRPNTTYLNPNFDGYKLSLHEIPTERKNLNASVDQVFPSENQFAFLYAKLFSLHNYLVGESYSDESFVYFVDINWHIQKVSSLLNIDQVWTVPIKHRKAGDYYFSLKFVSPKVAVLSDGVGSLFILNTNSRESINVEWKCMFSEDILGFEKPFVIQDAVLCNDKLHCLLFSIEESNINKHSAVLNVLTLACAEDETWCVLALRELQCQGDMHYAALEKSGKALYSISDVCLKFIVDSENPIVTKTTQFINNLQYEWLQTEESVTLQFLIEHELIKEDIFITTTKCNIKIEHKDVLLLEKDLCNDIQANTTWTINKNVLEILLFKECTGVTWPQVFKDDSRNIIQERGDSNITLNESKGPLFNRQQVEECDFDDDNSSIFERICLNSHQVTHRAVIGSRHVLLTTNINVETSPAMAIRYDVDACLWQPTEIDNSFHLQHIGTLPAFGYIQASKQQKKFSVCAADLSYSAISESTRHLFIYKHESIINSDLRNRRTGKYVNTVSQQHVVTLPYEMLGIYAANKHLFLLFENSISVLHM